MFDNIGSKIKTLAKILCVVEFILCLLAAFFLFQLSSKFGSAGGSLRLYGFVVLIFGPLIFWVGNFILYGFGELVDNSAIIARQTANNNQSLDKEAEEKHEQKDQIPEKEKHEEESKISDEKEQQEEEIKN